VEEQKTDPRTLKTKRAIRTAFSKLLSEKSFESITVYDITELAGVNRKTFYRNYKSIPQLVDEIEDDIIRSFDAFLDETDMISALEHPVLILKNLNALLEADRAMYGYLISLGENIGLVSKINKSVKEKAKRVSSEHKEFDEQSTEIILEYSISGMISVYKKWFLSDRRESIEKISETIGLLYTKGITGMKRG
jgi:AcrR family transcriptional regulator